MRVFLLFYVHFQNIFSKSNKNFRVGDVLLGRDGLPEANIFFYD